MRSMSTRSTALLLTLVAVLSLTAGCMPKASGERGPIQVDPVPSMSSVDLVLYFGDDQAMEVLPERRRVEVPSDPAQRETTAALVVKELLKGPQDPLLSKTLPPEAKLLSLEVANGIAHVNFSKEIQTKHWGGSAGETMSLLSLVTSLTQIDPLTSSSAITKVQILVEGKTVETLAGHFDISKPLERVIRTDRPFFTSKERAAALQKRVDGGQDQWRKDPLQVAKTEAPARGLHPSLDYKLSSQGSGEATVTVASGSTTYTTYTTPESGKVTVTMASRSTTYMISLVQPEKQGEGGVWVVSEIVAK